MKLVDCHAHLTHELYRGKVDEVLERALAAGVKRIVCSGINKPTNREVLALSEKYEMIQCTAGLYPTDLLGLRPDESGLTLQQTPLDIDTEFDWIRANKDKLVGVGEVGMDFKLDKERHEEQKKNFQRIIDEVEKLKLPIVIHSRKAEKECLDLLESSSIKHVMLHCFSGKKAQVKRAIDLGYFLSIPAVSKKLQHFQMVAEMAPLRQLLTETDSPWLTPESEGFNEPAHVLESIKVIAKAKGMTPEETALAVFQNYQEVFGR